MTMDVVLTDGSRERITGIFVQDEPIEALLRDIQLPDAVPVWPPAPGWWGLLLLVLLVLAFALFIWHRKGRLCRSALAELDELVCRYTREGDQASYVMGLSTLLRRVALAREPRRQVAGLVGDDWLAYLDSRGATSQFSSGQGRALLSLPYGGDAATDIDALTSLVRHWIRMNT
jgi:hypothetical protein